MHDTAGNEYSVTFSLLTPPAQQKLDEALAVWKSKDPVVRHLGRASAFTAFGLYGDAADECELALKQAPESALLLEMTAEAQQRTGNTGRAAEITKKLEQLTAKSQ
jgi:predicted Zn-dependent protease